MLLSKFEHPKFMSTLTTSLIQTDIENYIITMFVFLDAAT